MQSNVRRKLHNAKFGKSQRHLHRDINRFFSNLKADIDRDPETAKEFINNESKQILQDILQDETHTNIDEEEYKNLEQEATDFINFVREMYKDELGDFDPIFQHVPFTDEELIETMNDLVRKMNKRMKNETEKDDFSKDVVRFYENVLRYTKQTLRAESTISLLNSVYNFKKENSNDTNLRQDAHDAWKLFCDKIRELYDIDTPNDLRDTYFVEGDDDSVPGFVDIVNKDLRGKVKRKKIYHTKDEEKNIEYYSIRPFDEVKEILSYPEFVALYKTPQALVERLTYDRTKKKKSKKKSKEGLNETRKSLDANIIRSKDLEKLMEDDTEDLNIFERFNRLRGFNTEDIKKVISLKQQKDVVEDRILEMLKFLQKSNLSAAGFLQKLIDDFPKKTSSVMNQIMKTISYFYNKLNESKRMPKDLYYYFASDGPKTNLAKFRQLREYAEKYNVKDQKGDVKVLFEDVVAAIKESYQKIPNDIYLYLKFYDFEASGKGTLQLPVDVGGDKLKTFEFVPEDNKANILLQEYNLPENSGLGPYKLYLNICDKYIGITENDVSEYVGHRPEYQLTKQTHFVLNSPIIVKKPNARWAIDLIDAVDFKMVRCRYLLSVIDVFSKKCWIGVINKSKSSMEMKNTFMGIMMRAQVFPQAVMCDNGGEFQKSMLNWCHNCRDPERQGEEPQKITIYVEINGKFVQKPYIKIINTLSYTPRSNGLVENLNRFIRHLIRNLIVKEGKQNDWADSLKAIEDSKNNMVNATNGFSPNQLWTPIPFDATRRTDAEKVNGRYEYELVQGADETDTKLQALHKKTHDRQIHKAVMRKSPDIIFQEGAYVRVLSSSLSSKVRKLIKSGDKKKLLMTYSPDIFKISRVIKSTLPYRNTLYELEDLRYKITRNGEKTFVMTQIHPNTRREVKKKPKVRRFFGSELLLVFQGDLEELNQALRDYAKQYTEELDIPEPQELKGIEKNIVDENALTTENLSDED